MAHARYMLANNYHYAMRLLDHCQENDIPLLYASSAAVYGVGRGFREERACEWPLNVYGYSKFLFDQYVRGMLPERTAQVVGLRYFNVYGPREAHKERMASIVWQLFEQYRKLGRVQLFSGSDGYHAGEQRRDFVSVEDVVKVNLDFLDHPERSGIYNLGSGQSATFNAVAAATINACRAARGEAEQPFAELRRAGVIDYLEFPASLVGKYQSFTEADLSQLRTAGYRAPMMRVEEGVARYVSALLGSPAGDG